MANDGSAYEHQMGRWSRRLAPLLIDFAGIGAGQHALDRGKGKLRDALRLAYLDGDVDGPRSYAATAWVAKGRVP